MALLPCICYTRYCICSSSTPGVLGLCVNHFQIFITFTPQIPRTFHNIWLHTIVYNINKCLDCSNILLALLLIMFIIFPLLSQKLHPEVAFAHWGRLHLHSSSSSSSSCLLPDFLIHPCGWPHACFSAGPRDNILTFEYTTQSTVGQWMTHGNLC